MGQSMRPITKKHYLKLLIRRVTIRLLLLLVCNLNWGRECLKRTLPPKKGGKNQKDHTSED
jgi:hypothetical protein